MTIVTQPTNNGLYSAYYPIIFQVTDAANPTYLYFKLRKADGTTLNMPFYAAPNINGSYTFDVSSFIVSILNVRTRQGLSETVVEELTDIYGKYEVIVNDIADETGATITNEFYAFAMLDNTRLTNDQTANYAINGKQMHYSNALENGYIPTKIMQSKDRVILFAQSTYLEVHTFAINKPTPSTTATEVGKLNISAYANKLISVPLNKTFIASNFENYAVIPEVPIGNFKSFKVVNGNSILYHNVEDCNLLQFVFINRYGNKENITFKTYYNETVETKAETFQAHGFSHIGNTTYFNESANTEKINQDINQTFTVKGQKFTRNQSNALLDFIASPVHWVLLSELVNVVIKDGAYKIIEDGKGMEISFSYSFSQTKKTFK